MKKITILTLAMLMTLGVMAQYKQKHVIIPIANRASAIGVPAKIGDFIYIEADSAMYMTKVALSAAATGTYLTDTTSRYAVAKMATGSQAVTATTLTAGRTSLTDTISGNVVALFGGNIGIGTTAYNKFTIAGSSGNTAIAGTLGVTGNTTIGSNKVVITASSGNTAIAGTLSTVGNVAIGTTGYNKFTVAGTTGNTAIAGTLAVTGATTQTGKLTCADTVAAAVVTTSGQMLSTGDLKVNTNKFVVTASNGNTAIAGTLNSTGLATLSAGAVVTADTTTAVVGKMVFVAADSSFYGCRSTVAAKKWYKLHD